MAIEPIPVNELPTKSPATVAVLRDLVGVPVLEGRVTTIEGKVNNPSLKLSPVVQTVNEDTTASGNVFTSAVTNGGPVRLKEFWINGFGGTYTSGQRALIDKVGRVTIYSDGEWEFVPDLNWNGTVPTIYVMATNGDDLKATTIDIQVTSVNDPPVVSPDVMLTKLNTPVIIPVLADDYDPEDDPLTVTKVNNAAIVIGTPVAVDHGSVTVNVDQTMTFTPETDYNGKVEFTYAVSDGQLETEGRVLVQVGYDDFPMFSPVNPMMTNNYFDDAAMNFGLTELEWYGEAYGNGVNVTELSYTAERGRPDLTVKEPWLYDRATVVYKLYLRTGNPDIRAKALSLAELYFSKISPVGDYAYFLPNQGAVKDPKYQYPLVGYWYERETGNQTYRPTCKLLADGLYDEFPPIWNEDINPWTERNLNYAMQGQLAYYWISGDAAYLSRANEYFNLLVTMSVDTGAALHTYFQHENEGPGTMVSSPWMTGLVIETLIQLYRTTWNQSILSWISRYCDFILQYGFYVNYEEPAYIGFRIPAYLVGTSAQFVEGDIASDAEHCYDISVVLQKGLWAKQQLNQDTGTIQRVIFEMQTVAKLVFDDWTRTTVGLPKYRILPARKYGWWFSSAYSTINAADSLTPGPVLTTAPVLTGSTTMGNILTYQPGVYQGSPTITFQWLRDDVVIAGATSTTYVTQTADIGHAVRVAETATLNGVQGVYSTASIQIVAVPTVPLALTENFDYVDTQSAAYQSFISFVDAKQTGGSPYGYSPEQAAVAYRLTNDEKYRTLAIQGINDYVDQAEANIAANENVTLISGDSYLEVGSVIGALARVYAWCNPDSATKTRWAAIADQAIYNVWNPSTAAWGGNAFPWTGWAINDPGNNYHYSFLMATATWALASGNQTWIDFLNNEKLPALRAYYANLDGGGSREGTGYGISLRGLFAFYQIWEDSSMPNLSQSSSHLNDTLKYWTHAVMPTLNRYCPIGDLSRESFPNLFDYHRDMVLRSRMLSTDSAANDDGSWWLNNISVQQMSQGFMHIENLMPAGANTSTPPTALSYYSEGTGSLFTRTAWASDAVFFHFIAGTYDQSHAHQEQGSFVLYKDTFLAVTNNIFSHSGIQQGVKSNNVLRFQNSSGVVIAQKNGTAAHTHSIGSNGDVQAQANLKDIMNDATVTQWNRSVDFTNGILTVSDSFATTNGTTAVFQVCTPTLPTVSGDTATAGDLQIRVLSPAGATFTVVQASAEDADFTDGGYRLDISGGTTQYVVELRSLTHSPDDGTTPITITSQPTPFTGSEGETVTFSVAASGSAPITYQWEYQASGSGVWNNAVGASATTSTYTGTLALADDGAQMRCVLTNPVGSVTSNAVAITVGTPVSAPVFTVQPQNASLTDGATANFTVTATGDAPITYQWQNKPVSGVWADINGATSDTYSPVVNTSMDGWQIRCAATNGGGTTNSDPATLTVTSASQGSGELLWNGPSSANTQISTDKTTASVATGSATEWASVWSNYLVTEKVYFEVKMKIVQATSKWTLLVFTGNSTQDITSVNAGQIWDTPNALLMDWGNRLTWNANYGSATASSGTVQNFAGADAFVMRVCIDPATRQVWAATNDMADFVTDPATGTGETFILGGTDPIMIGASFQSSDTTNYATIATTAEHLYAPPTGFTAV